MIYYIQFLTTSRDAQLLTAREGFPRKEKEMEEQEAKQIVEMLLKGSRGIDLMRKEINSVVGTVLGLIKPFYKWGDGKRTSDELSLPGVDNKFVWEISSDKRSNFKVRFLFGGKEIYYYYETNTRSINIQMDHVKIVYDNLYVFIALMEKNFSLLNQSWKPLLEIATLED